jgi:hypothetical protein
MKSQSHSKKSNSKSTSLPPGIVPYKGAKGKVKGWHEQIGEPDDLAHAGVSSRMRQAALKK